MPRRLLIAVALLLLVSAVLIGSRWWFSHHAPAQTAATRTAQATTQEAIPSTVVISSAYARVTIFLPDLKAGHYRGSRFDWSGMIDSVETGGHRFYGSQASVQPDPTSTDANAEGPADEYGQLTPPGYKEAQIGEPFLKLGIGLLIRDGKGPYRFTHTYRIDPLAPWTTETGTNFVQFVQVLDPVNSAWGYRYSKRIELIPDSAGYTIAYSLTNTGRRPIHTDWYCHNFMNIDGVPIGPGYQISFPFAATVRKPKSLKDMAAMVDGTFKVTRLIPPGESIAAELAGLTPGRTSDYGATVSLGSASVRFTGSLPPSRLFIWGSCDVLCAEPYMDLELEPGASKEWDVRYEFETVGR